MLARTMALMI